MNLNGSITELQNRMAQLYLKLEQRFKENGLIRELWSAMAHDVTQHKSSLKALPTSFWNQIKKDPDGQLEAAVEGARLQIIEKADDLSLSNCFHLALQIEEPTILKIYVPIIRSLRKNLTNPALDFYIVVKAHLTRIVRVTESFSGDPKIIQQSNSLLQSFEKEVQGPELHIRHPEKKTPIGRRAQGKKSGKKQKESLKPKRPLAKHSKIHHNRTKPLVKKVSLQRRRAHR